MELNIFWNWKVLTNKKNPLESFISRSVWIWMDLRIKPDHQEKKWASWEFYDKLPSVLIPMLEIKVGKRRDRKNNWHNSGLPNLIKDKNLYVQEHNKQKDPETKANSHRKIHYQLLKDRTDYEKKKDLAYHVVILNSINLFVIRKNNSIFK